MPDKIIEIPNVGRIAFPDSMTPDEMNAAAAKLYREKNPDHPPPDPKHSWVDTAVDWLPTVGGIVGGIAGGAVGGPPGAIAGAALGGAAGEGYKQTARFARGQAVPTTESQMAGQLAGSAALQGGAEAIGAGAGALAKPLAQTLMQSALKPGLKTALQAVKAGNVPPVVNTLLKEGASVSPAGIERLNTLIGATNDEIKSALAPVADLPINPFKVTAKLGETAQRFSQQVNPARDLGAVSRAGQEFLSAHPDLTVGEAQAIKQGTYQQLAGKYGELKGAEVEAQKSLARGLKDEIAAEVGQSLAGLKGKLGMEGGVDLGNLNAREGALIAARDAVARRVTVAGNRDAVGLAGLAVSHPLTFLTVLADRHPAFKSMVARGLYSSAGAMTNVAPQVIKAAVQAVASGDSDAGAPSR